MSVRTALNVVYAMLCEGKDAKQRRALDEAVYGWGDQQEQGNKILFGNGGGEG